MLLVLGTTKASDGVETIGLLKCNLLIFKPLRPPPIAEGCQFIE